MACERPETTRPSVQEIEQALETVLARYGLRSGPEAATRGCICPPGAEATCRGAMCPRRPFGAAA